MSLTLKKQNAIRQFLKDCYEIYQDSGSIDEDDFNECAEQIFSLWTKKISCSTNEKYPCGCSRGRGRPKSDCKLILSGRSHKDYKNMSESEMTDFYNKVINSEEISVNDSKINCNSKKLSDDVNVNDSDSESDNENDISEDEEDIDIFSGDKFTSQEEYYNKILGNSVTKFKSSFENMIEDCDEEIDLDEMTDFNDEIKQSKKSWALTAGYEIINNNFNENDNIDIIKQITNELEGCIEYHLLLNEDGKKYSEIFWDSKRQMIISRKEKTKKSSCKIDIKQLDEIPEDPIAYINKKVNDRVSRGSKIILSIK